MYVLHVVERGRVMSNYEKYVMDCDFEGVSPTVIGFIQTELLILWNKITRSSDDR